MNIDSLLTTLRHNEKIARKLFDIENRILGTTQFGDLFGSLLSEIETQFEIPHVWLTLVHAEALTCLITGLQQAPHTRGHLVIIDQPTFSALVGYSASPLLLNAELDRYAPLVPPTLTSSLGSLAIVPIHFEGRIIGSFNQGDIARDRFGPDKDTFFLRQLAVKVSICLANVMAHEQLRLLATRDPLTALGNRRELETILHREFERSRRQGQPLAVLFLDCDDFKQVNDTHGHEAGDAYLHHVACEMSKAIRTSDCAFRFAGDEFVILLPGQQEEEARRMGERLRQQLTRTPLIYDGKPVPVMLSLGAASSREEGVRDGPSLLRLADARLYEDKKGKANRGGTANG